MQTRRALKQLSQGKVNYDRVSSSGPLADNASWLLERHAEQQQKTAEAQQRHEVSSKLPLLEAARQKLLHIIGERVLPDDAPIAMRFDVFHVIKSASKSNPKDVGLKNFATHMERLWHEDPLGTISAGALTRFRDHYQKQHARSIVGSAVDKLVPTIAFNNLPVAKLARIAAEIETQEDYNVAMMRHGLHNNDIKNIRARTFIRELVNRKAQALEIGVQVVDGDAQLGTAQQSRAGNAGDRVISRIEKGAQATPKSDATAESDTEAESDGGGKIKSEDLGMAGTGVLSTTAMLKEQDEMHKWAIETGSGIPKVAVAPPGWEESVKKMKGKEEIDNPFALAWWMEGKGYKPEGGEKKEAQTPYGQPWSAENVVEIANDALGEMENPEVAQIIEKLVGPGIAPGSQDQASALIQALQASPGDMRKLQDVIYKSIMAEDPAEQPAEQPQVSEQYTMPQSEMMPSLASKKEKGKGKLFDPQINEQQKPQLPIKPGDGLKVIKAWAIPASHPLVDDDMNRFPLMNEDHLKFAERVVNKFSDTPNWWLGSIEELRNTVLAAIKEAKIPPQFEKNIKKKKDEKGEEKDEKDEKGKNPFAKDSSFELSFEERCANMGLDKENIESKLVSGSSVKKGGYSIEVLNSEGNEIVRIASEKGKREYPLIDIDSAITDFVYLAATEKHVATPPPMFYVREGIRLACPGCGIANSYPMPKEAADLSCTKCNIVIPSHVVQAAFDGNAAKEEVVLVAITPLSLQEEFGEKFAKAAEMMGADELGAVDSIAEAYSISASNEKMADVWDFMVEAGFQPLAQSMSNQAPAPTNAPMITAQDDLPMLPPEAPEPVEEMGLGDPGMEEIGETPGGEGWADHQMIQAAMMYYQSQGNNVLDAIANFKKEYGEGQYDPEMVLQIASTVYGIGLDRVKVAMTKDAGDIPSTKVNQQQPDTVTVGKGNALLGPDSDTHGDIKTPGKPKSQVKPQGQFSDTGTEPDSDNNDPGDFGAGKPKVQHPATDQKGVKVPATGLGPDSETQMGGVMKNMDSKSKAAPQSMQSK